MSLTPISPSRSSWIRGVGYVSSHRTSDGHSYLAIFTNGRFAWLVRDVPSTLPGLLVSGHVTAKDDGELSIGSAVHRFVLQAKDETTGELKYPRQKVEGKEMWRLRALMMAGANPTSYAKEISK